MTNVEFVNVAMRVVQIGAIGWACYNMGRVKGMKDLMEKEAGFAVSHIIRELDRALAPSYRLEFRDAVEKVLGKRPQETE